MIDLLSQRKQNFSCIYKISSKKTGRFYVGSAKHFGIRRRNHVYQLSKNKHHSIILQNHVNKYGMQDIYFEILEVCEWGNLIIEREQYYIDSLNPFFNVLRTASSCMGRIASDETRNKLVVSHLGKKQTQETKDKRRLAMLGRKFSEESKAKMKSSWRPRKLSEDAKYKQLSALRKPIKVYCIEKRMEYPSIGIASKLLNCSVVNISNVCKGKIESTNGLTFKYA